MYCVGILVSSSDQKAPKKLGEMSKVSDFGILRNSWFLNKLEVSDYGRFGSMLNNNC